MSSGWYIHMQIVNTIQFHLQHPEVQAPKYVRSRHIEFADSIIDRVKIYLDTRYWVLFRDVAMGRRSGDDFTVLLEKIRSAVRDKRAICPLSHESFSEVFTQSDTATLEATVRLIDELSAGSCLTEQSQRLNTEAYHFFVRKTKGEESVYRLNQLVWTKVGYVLGYVTPRVPELPAATANAMEKAFFDQMWTVTLHDMFQSLGSRPEWRRERDIIDSMNQGKAASQSDFHSFKQLFLIELRGILDTLEPALSEIMAEMYKQETGDSPSEADRLNEKSGKIMANLIYHAFRLNKMQNELPTLRVHASLHAALRWDRKRNYKFNDLSDLRHAAMAIPYCDVFLTEEPLRKLVNKRHLGLTERFPCRSFSNPSEALARLIVLGL